MENVENIIFDRAHRVGQRSAATRPIVVKFHYYSQREKVRQTAFGVTEELKSAKLGVGAQIPKDIRDSRKPLYPAMKKAKDEGKSAKSYLLTVANIKRGRQPMGRWNISGVEKSDP